MPGELWTLKPISFSSLTHQDMKLGQIQVLHMDGCSFEAPVYVSSFEISLHFPVATSHHMFPCQGCI